MGYERVPVYSPVYGLGGGDGSEEGAEDVERFQRFQRCDVEGLIVENQVENAGAF